MDTSHGIRKGTSTIVPDIGTPPKAATNTNTVGISPGRKIHMRSECIEQLQKIGQLLESGNISQDQYGKLQDSIMNDITKY